MLACSHMIDKQAIGRRIVEAREKHGLMTQQALADALNQAAQRLLGGKATGSMSRQTVQHWEKGKVVPPWDKLELLAAVFGDQYDEEWIMFGQRRQQQLAEEKPLLVYLTQQEAELINDFRHANDYGKRSIRINAKAVSQDQPAPEAGVHLMRRSTDKLIK